MERTKCGENAEGDGGRFFEWTSYKGCGDGGDCDANGEGNLLVFLRRLVNSFFMFALIFVYQARKGMLIYINVGVIYNLN